MRLFESSPCPSLKLLELVREKTRSGFGELICPKEKKTSHNLKGKSNAQRFPFFSASYPSLCVVTVQIETTHFLSPSFLYPAFSQKGCGGSRD